MTTLVTTALAMLDTLAATTEPLSPHELRAGIAARDGDPNRVQDAAKWLRDRGVLLGAEKRGRRSRWWKPLTEAECVAYIDRVVTEAYSELTSVARMASSLSDPAPRTKATTAAVVVGERLGLDPARVIEACEPLSMPGT